MYVWHNWPWLGALALHSPKTYLEAQAPFLISAIRRRRKSSASSSCIEREHTRCSASAAPHSCPWPCPRDRSTSWEGWCPAHSRRTCRPEIAAPALYEHAWLVQPGGRGGGDLAAAGGAGARHQQRGARGAGEAGARGPGGAGPAAEVGRGGLRRSWSARGAPSGQTKLGACRGDTVLVGVLYAPMATRA